MLTIPFIGNDEWEAALYGGNAELKALGRRTGIHVSLLGTPSNNLLDVPVASLVLVPTGKLLAILDAVRAELRSAGIIHFKPIFSFGDSGFWCADRALTINIPWFLANTELYELAQRRHPMRWFDVARGVRHEVGHAVNYAFELWKRPDWTAMFGDFLLPYPEPEGSWPIVRGSPNFVEYVQDSGPGYGQRHPDEDWAETFACWLDPSSDWRRHYKAGALRKLLYVDSLSHGCLRGWPVNSDLGEHKDWRSAYPGQTVRNVLLDSLHRRHTET